MFKLRMAVAAGLLIVCSTQGTTQDYGRESLKGLKKAKVVIQLAGDDAGMIYSENDLKVVVVKAVNAHLNTGGVTRLEIVDAGDVAELIVRIKLKKIPPNLAEPEKQPYIANLQVSVRQKVEVLRDGGVRVPATIDTWRYNDASVGPRGRLKTAHESLIADTVLKQLALDFFAAQ